MDNTTEEIFKAYQLCNEMSFRGYNFSPLDRLARATGIGTTAAKTRGTAEVQANAVLKRLKQSAVESGYKDESEALTTPEGVKWFNGWIDNTFGVPNLHADANIQKALSSNAKPGNIVTLALQAWRKSKNSNATQQPQGQQPQQPQQPQGQQPQGQQPQGQQPQQPQGQQPQGQQPQGQQPQGQQPQGQQPQQPQGQQPQQQQGQQPQQQQQPQGQQPRQPQGRAARNSQQPLTNNQLKVALKGKKLGEVMSKKGINKLIKDIDNIKKSAVGGSGAAAQQAAGISNIVFENISFIDCRYF